MRATTRYIGSIKDGSARSGELNFQDRVFLNELACVSARA
jgi:hypothetical protein